jgi:hypothetical protein
MPFEQGTLRREDQMLFSGRCPDFKGSIEAHRVMIKRAG